VEQKKYSGVVQQLLAAGCDMDATRFFPVHYCIFAGATPLFVAAHEGCEDIVEQLLKAGCNWKKANRYNQTPLDIAKLRGEPNVVHLLQKKSKEEEEKFRTKFRLVLCGCMFPPPNGADPGTKVVDKLVNTGHIASLYNTSDILNIVLHVGIAEYRVA
jgi:hypothetical protein